MLGLKNTSKTYHTNDKLLIGTLNASGSPKVDLLSLSDSGPRVGRFRLKSRLQSALVDGLLSRVFSRSENNFELAHRFLRWRLGTSVCPHQTIFSPPSLHRLSGFADTFVVTCKETPDCDLLDSQLLVYVMPFAGFPASAGGTWRPDSALVTPASFPYSCTKRILENGDLLDGTWHPDHPIATLTFMG